MHRMAQTYTHARVTDRRSTIFVRRNGFDNGMVYTGAIPTRPNRDGARFSRVIIPRLKIAPKPILPAALPLVGTPERYARQSAVRRGIGEVASEEFTA